MRIGGKGSVVDNAHAGGCYVGINQDGTFCHEVLDKDSNPHLIEFNCMYYSSWLFQYTTGPAFGPFTQEILEYCKDNSAYNYAYLKI